MTPVVVDASIAVKWIIDEDGTEAALALRHRPLAAPDLLTAECANVLWKKVRRGELSLEEAAFAARLLARADLDLMPMRRFLEPAIRIAVALGHPAYGCVYLAMAEAEDLSFVTADDRLLRKVRQEPSGRFAARVVSLNQPIASG